jgi:hypothetical protein
MLQREITAVCESRTERINKLCEENALLMLNAVVQIVTTALSMLKS